MTLALPPAVFDTLARVAHDRSLREGRHHGVATVIRSLISEKLGLPSGEDAVLRRLPGRPRREAPPSAVPIRHRSPPAGSRGSQEA